LNFIEKYFWFFRSSPISFLFQSVMTGFFQIWNFGFENVQILWFCGFVHLVLGCSYYVSSSWKDPWWKNVIEKLWNLNFFVIISFHSCCLLVVSFLWRCLVLVLRGEHNYVSCAGRNNICSLVQVFLYGCESNRSFFWISKRNFKTFVWSLRQFVFCMNSIGKCKFILAWTFSGVKRCWI